MNRRAMTKPFTTPAALLTLAALALAALAACAPSAPKPAIQGTDIAGTPIGGDFALLDKDGKPVKWQDFAGRYRIVYFGYTFCPDACPTDVGVMMAGYAKFEKAQPELAAKVQPIFISIDPARDTPARVGEFTAAFSPRLIGLTGPQAEVDRAVKAFRAYAARGEDSAGGYLMDHSRSAYLMDPEGKPIEILPVDKDAGAVAADLAASVH